MIALAPGCPNLCPNLGREDILDEDEDTIPKQDLYLVTLANGMSFAARGSGTEPKMKFYIFSSAKVGIGGGPGRREGTGTDRTRPHQGPDRSRR